MYIVNTGELSETKQGGMQRAKELCAVRMAGMRLWGLGGTARDTAPEVVQIRPCFTFEDFAIFLAVRGVFPTRAAIMCRISELKTQ